MRRTSILSLALVVLLGTFASAAFAASGHFITSGKNAPQCFDRGTYIECTGKVAGLGGDTFQIDVSAPGTAIVECENPGGNVAPGQDTSLTVTGTTGPLATPRNGQYVFSITTDPPTVANFPTCPNPQWTAHVVDVIFGDATLTLSEDGVVSDEVVVPVG